MTAEEVWNEAQKAFTANPTVEGRDQMLAAYTEFYLVICDGSSIGLDQERARLRQRADEVLGSVRVRESA
jgi:hypothetical protein